MYPVHDKGKYLVCTYIVQGCESSIEFGLSWSGSILMLHIYGDYPCSVSIGSKVDTDTDLAYRIYNRLVHDTPNKILTDSREKALDDSGLRDVIESLEDRVKSLEDRLNCSGLLI